MSVQDASPKSTGRGVLPLALLALLAAVALVASLYAIFFMAPVERQMGIVQKIFYFHVPSAYAMYLSFITCAIASGLYLATAKEQWDALGVAGAEAGSLFCAIVLITGPLWARKAWGVFWTWEPRLTSTLLIGLVYFAYLSLRALGASGEVERRFAAALGVVGALDIPIIHYAVYRWRGIHPAVITSGGGGMVDTMWPALVCGFLFFTLLAAVLIWLRARSEALRRCLRALEADAARAND
jgi:heme exporter protein C